jgi:energy-coupling factor transport system ATP-binding protein
MPDQPTKTKRSRLSQSSRTSNHPRCGARPTAIVMRFHLADWHRALNHCSFTIPGPAFGCWWAAMAAAKALCFRMIAGLLEPQSRANWSAPCKPPWCSKTPTTSCCFPAAAATSSLASQPSPRPSNGWIASPARAGGARRLWPTPTIHTLSGGQKQRLAIAGALASEANCCCSMSPQPCSTHQPKEVINRSTALPPLRATHHSPLDHPSTGGTDWCDGAALMEKGSIGPWQAGKNPCAAAQGPCD